MTTIDDLVRKLLKTFTKQQKYVVNGYTVIIYFLYKINNVRHYNVY